MPELLFQAKGEQNIGPCLWREGTTNWMFTGWADGRRPFRVSRSTDRGETWTMVAPTPRFSSRNWGATSVRACVGSSAASYLLDGVETHYYENGQKQSEVTWANGRRTGEETLWAANGEKFWTWSPTPRIVIRW